MAAPLQARAFLPRPDRRFFLWSLTSLGAGLRLTNHGLKAENRSESSYRFRTRECSRCCSPFAFPVYVCLVVVLLSVPATGDLRRLAGMARLSHLIPFSFCFGTYDDGVDVLRMNNNALWMAN